MPFYVLKNCLLGGGKTLGNENKRGRNNKDTGERARGDP